MWTFRIAALAVFWIASASLANAHHCNENEGCSHCILRRPWDGKCAQRGNDPICEARKARCQAEHRLPVQVPGPLGPSGPLPSLPGEQASACLRNLKACAEDTVRQLPGPDLIESCVQNPWACPERIAKTLPYEAVRRYVQAYKNGLVRQAEGRWSKLPEWFIREFSDDFREIDLRAVQLATGINTGHGQAITFHYQIFFPGHLDFQERDDMELVLHELEHTVQYQRRGGEAPFLSEYFISSFVQVHQHGPFSVHDHIPLERDATNKASALINEYGWNFVLKNTCHKPVQFALYFRNNKGDWGGHGMWTVEASKTSFPGINEVPMRTTNRIFYWYAEVQGTNYAWIGSHEYPVGDRRLKFREERPPPNTEKLEVSVSCPNLTQ